MDYAIRPKGWFEMSEDEFEKYLVFCPDFRRDVYVGRARYYYAHNEETFAVLVNGKLLVHPDVRKAGEA